MSPPVGGELVSVPADEDLTVVQRPDGSVVTVRLPGGVGFGWRSEELVDVALPQLIHPDDEVVAVRGRSWCLTTGTSQTVNLRIRAPGGRWIWSETTFQRVELDDGEAGTQARMRDVSERGLSTEALGLVLGLRSYIDAANDVDQGWREALVRVVRFLNLDRAYRWRLIDGEPVVDLYVGDVAAPPDSVTDGTDARLAEMLASDAPAPVSGDRKSRDPMVSDRVYTVAIAVTEPAAASTNAATSAVIEFESAQPIRGAGVIDLAQEVFERLGDAFQRKIVQTELDVTRQQLSLAFDEAPIGIALVGADGRFVRVNRALSELLEYPVDELLDRRFQDVSHPLDVAAATHAFDQLLAGIHDQAQIETRVLRSDGSVVWALFSVAVVRDREGQAIEFIVQFVDISTQKAREFQLANRQGAIVDADPVESLDMFLRSQPVGLPLGLVRAEFHPSAADDDESIRQAFARLEAQTRLDDYFARVGPTEAIVFASALADDEAVATGQLESIRARIEEGLHQVASDVALDVGARLADPVETRAGELLGKADR